VDANAQFMFLSQFVQVLGDCWTALGFPLRAIIGISLLIAMTFALIAFFESNRIGG